jgi:DNA-binding PadR family transcriptional regulator
MVLESRLTDAELLVLGLVAEMPRHGYELEQVIEQRSMREWTQIGFSSIYFVLGKLEARGLIEAGREAGSSSKSRKVYSITKAGRLTLKEETQAALSSIRPTYSSVLLGMINWPALERHEALRALEARTEAIETEVARLADLQSAQQPLPDFVEALFEHSIGQLRSEAEWVARSLDYMATKPWLD